MNSQADPWIGQRLGRYRLTERLGGGGGGSVYAAYDETLDREVALKIFNPQATATPEMAARFQHEARVTARLNHPGIVPIYDVGEDRGVSYIAMRRLPGTTLGNRLAGGPLSEEEALDITLALLDALAYAHARGIVHRDLKPANVLFDEDGRPMLVDFGIAKALDGQSVTLTEHGTVVGTPPYMSPEQVTGQAVDPRSDLYSLGILLYQMVTGKPPFMGSSYEVMSAHRDQPPPLPHLLRPTLDRDLEHIILKALRKGPGERFQSASEFAEALHAVQRGESPAIAPVPPEAAAPTRVYDQSVPAPGTGVPRPVVRTPMQTGRARAETRVIPGGTARTGRAVPVPEPEGRRFPIWTLAFLTLLLLCIGGGAVVGAMYLPALGSSGVPAPGGIVVLPTESPTITPEPGVTPSATTGLPTLPVPPGVTESPTPSPSATPSPTETVTPTAEPSETPNPTETPVPTDTPEPTATTAPTATLEPTPVPTPGCDIAPDSVFVNFYDRARMGCPTAPAYEADSPYQQFDDGFMLLDPTLEIVYAFDEERSVWGSYASEWEPGDPPYSCPQAENEGGPTGDFGWVWCNNPDVRNALGDIVTTEIISPVTFQPTEESLMMNIPARLSRVAIFQDRSYIEQ